MAVDKKKLRNLFGVGEEEKPKAVKSVPVPAKPKDIFAEPDDDMEIIADDSGEEVTFLPQEEEEIMPVNVKRKPKTKGLSSQDYVADTQFAVETLQDLLVQAQKAVGLALEGAADGGTARDREVLNGSIEMAANTAEKLLTMYEKLNKIQQQNNPTDGGGNTYVQNNIVFKGTTADVLKSLQDGSIDIDKI